ncbi:MAG: tetraacyldisaccharide 4'-kinase [Bdellovibrionales bacterium]
MRFTPVQVVSEAILGMATELRNLAYSANIIKKTKLDNLKVISVGNLSFGGTGKTPFVAYLAERLPDSMVLCRAYRASLKKDLKEVFPSDKASEVGDEASMLKDRLKNRVFSCRTKWLGASLISQKNEEGTLIVDDAFQHRKLDRDLDIVLIDASKSIDELKFPPVGRARETAASLRRADIIVLTKITNKGPHFIELKNFLKGFGVPIIETKYNIVFQTENRAFKSYVQISAIGNPQHLRKSLESLGIPIEKQYDFSDHHPYQSSDLDEVQTYLSNHPEVGLITTAKDYTKLKSLMLAENLLKTVVVDQSVEIIEGGGELDAALSSLYS